jgi:glycosyltransferase involved in cell wall biosynthesis
VIPNGVDTEVFKNTHAETGRRFREKMGIKGSIVGLYVGRLEPAKGLDVLITAVADVVEAFPMFKLVVVGSGSYHRILVDLAKELNVDKHIVFCDATDNVRKYYEIADIFVLPSRSEGISNALLEAMSMGLPIVATAVGGTPEVIKDMKNGCLVSLSSDEIAEKLKLLIVNKDLRYRVGKEARKTVVSSFGIERTTEEYLKLYALKAY